MLTDSASVDSGAGGLVQRGTEPPAVHCVLEAFAQWLAQEAATHGGPGFPLPRASLATELHRFLHAAAEGVSRTASREL